MYLFNTITVKPKLPKKIEHIQAISENLWWSWNTQFLELFKYIDKVLWEEVEKNPYKFLRLVDQTKLENAANDDEFIKKYNSVRDEFVSYMNSKNTFLNRNHSKYNSDKEVIAYFSAEYGLDQILPLYSGGLGVLSGDHLKSASDLGLPFVGIGLLYREGFFKQRLDKNGKQETVYIKTEIDNLPIFPLMVDGKQMKIFVEIGDDKVYAGIWYIKVGRVILYLLDTDVQENSVKYKYITYRLYGGDKANRIYQEVLLGIGGVRLLKKLGYEPKIYHMNEGHSAFLIFELIKDIMRKKQVNFYVAKEYIKYMTVFTTHTPVPAGNDVFSTDLIKNVFKDLYSEFGINEEEFLELGMTKKDKENGNFNMGVFALKHAGKKNGVSRLHGKVSRELFSDVWPNTSGDESPIDYVTNGIHTNTWLAPNIKKLYSKYLDPNWKEYIEKDEIWEKIYNIPNMELWNVHQSYKRRLIRLIRENVLRRKIENGEDYNEVEESIKYFDDNVLTIGFARRFATYKRATLIFSDLSRLDKIINNPKYPVRFVFAGKAHPDDKLGQELIQKINEIALMPNFKGKIVLLENYDMSISRVLVSGVDIWLNTPRRPYEASGTSGQKASVNGIINFSILDGWWDEGYNSKNGFAIAETRKEYSEYEQDRVDTISFYDILENEIMLKYYNRENGVYSNEWLSIMKNSIVSNSGRFSTQRMVIEYFEKIYKPLIDKQEYALNITNIIEYLKWKTMIKQNISKVELNEIQNISNVQLEAGEIMKTQVVVDFKDLNKEDFEVQTYLVKMQSNGNIEHINSYTMKEKENIELNKYIYEIEFEMPTGGNFAYTFRILPKNKMMLHFCDIDIAKWYQEDNINK